MLDILVAWFAYFLYMNLPVNVWIKTMRVAHSIFFDSRWQYYTSHSTTEWWLASIGISNSAGLIASLFFSPSFFFHLLKSRSYFQKAFVLLYFGFYMCLCFFCRKRGEKSISSFKTQFQWRLSEIPDLILILAMYKAFQMGFSVIFEYLKK